MISRRSFLAGTASLIASKAMSAQGAQFYKWICLSEDGGMAPRDSGSAFEFNDRLWISNGYQVGSVAVRDLLSSDDGVRWQMVNPATPYNPYASICSYDGWIYVYDGQMRRSRDGMAFEDVPISGEARFDPEAPMIEKGGKLVVIGTTGVSSFDPKTCSFVFTPYPFPRRIGSSRTVFNDRVFVVAGSKAGANTPPENKNGYPDQTSLNEVWSTANPEDPNGWVKHETPPWVARKWPGICVHAGHLYVCGGYNNYVAENMNDTWRSADGDTWERVVCESDYTARHAPMMFSRNGRLLMVTGNTNAGTSVQKDVWELRWA